MDIGRITFSTSSALAGVPIPMCKPPKNSSGKSAEEMLIKEAKE